VKVEDGIVMFGLFSIGWNFHRSRQIRTLALPLALSFCNTREGGPSLIVTLGPLTFIWLR
jgi:hypothetical protein